MSTNSLVRLDRPRFRKVFTPMLQSGLRFIKDHSHGAIAAASVIGGILLWEIVARWVIQDKLFLVAPTVMIVRAMELIKTGELQEHTITSGLEFVIGFGLASIVGILGGLLIGVNRTARSISAPWISAMNSTPTVALSPLLILWFGLGLSSKVVVVFIVSVFSVLVNTQAGVEDADPRLIETARAFGAKRWQIFLKILLPASVPYIVAGLRLGVGRALVGVVVAELFGATSGLGYMITTASQIFDMAALFTAISILAVAGVLSTELIRIIERRIAPWRN